MMDRRHRRHLPPFQSVVFMCSCLVAAVVVGMPPYNLAGNLMYFRHVCCPGRHHRRQNLVVLSTRARSFSRPHRRSHTTCRSRCSRTGSRSVSAAGTSWLPYACSLDAGDSGSDERVMPPSSLLVSCPASRSGHSRLHAS